MKKKWSNILILVILIILIGTTFIIWYRNALNECKENVGSCFGKCDFKSVLTKTYHCMPPGYNAGHRESPNGCNCLGDECMCQSRSTTNKLEIPNSEFNVEYVEEIIGKNEIDNTCDNCEWTYEDCLREQAECLEMQKNGFREGCDDCDFIFNYLIK